MIFLSSTAKTQVLDKGTAGPALVLGLKGAGLIPLISLWLWCQHILNFFTKKHSIKHTGPVSKNTMFSVLSEGRFILSWSIFVSGVSDPSFSPHLKWVAGCESRAEHPNFPMPPPPQWSPEGAFLKQCPNVLWGQEWIHPLPQWAHGSGNNWHSTVAFMKEQLPLLPQPPHTPTKPTANTLWHWESSCSLNKPFAPGKAGSVLQNFMAVAEALQLNRARGTFSSTALMCCESHRHFATNFPCYFSWYKMLSRLEFPLWGPLLKDPAGFGSNSSGLSTTLLPAQWLCKRNHIQTSAQF